MSLFTPDTQENDDPIYKHLATLEQHIGKISENHLQSKMICRQRVCGLWEKHEQKLDKNKSKKEIKTHFNSVFWELSLCEFLTSCGFIFSDRKKKDPDFRCTHSKTQNFVCFEAISAKSGEGRNNAQIEYTNTSDLKDGDTLPVHYYDANPLKLRITQAVHDKSHKFKKYLEDGLVSDTDFLVISAHYSHEMGFLSGTSGLTVFHESVFPLGPVQVAFDTKTNQPIKVDNVLSPSILKHNGTEIDTLFFLSDSSSHISGLLFSDISYTSDDEANSSIGFIHNPMAKNPLPHGMFGALGYGEWEAILSDDYWQILRVPKTP